MQLARTICSLQDIVDLQEAMKPHSQKIAELPSEPSDIANLYSGPVVREIEQNAKARN
jgi:hypothetical protein